MSSTLEPQPPAFMYAGRPYLRAPVPVVFPSEEEMPETGRHLKLRTLLFQLLEHNFGKTASIGSEQFVYWDTQNPSQCCAPDVFVRLGQPQTLFDIWKVWERGAPDVAVEIISPSDASEADWAAKLTRYTAMGVRELVRFDPAANDKPLRIWDNLEGDLVERDLRGGTACVPLELRWVVVAQTDVGSALRLAKGEVLLLTEQEEERRAKEEERRAKEEERRAKEVAESARKAAEERALAAEAELAELRKRLSGLEQK